MMAKKEENIIREFTEAEIKDLDIKISHVKLLKDYFRLVFLHLRQKKHNYFFWLLNPKRMYEKYLKNKIYDIEQGMDAAQKMEEYLYNYNGLLRYKEKNQMIIAKELQEVIDNGNKSS